MTELAHAADIIVCLVNCHAFQHEPCDPYQDALVWLKKKAPDHRVYMKPVVQDEFDNLPDDNEGADEIPRPEVVTSDDPLIVVVGHGQATYGLDPIAPADVGRTAEPQFDACSCNAIGIRSAEFRVVEYHTNIRKHVAHSRVGCYVVPLLVDESGTDDIRTDAPSERFDRTPTPDELRNAIRDFIEAEDGAGTTATLSERRRIAVQRGDAE